MGSRAYEKLGLWDQMNLVKWADFQLHSVFVKLSALEDMLLEFLP